MTMIIPLPAEVAQIYEAVAALKRKFPTRKFTPDGHLLGSLGEVIAAEALGLTLYPDSWPVHDAYDARGDVQVKMTGRRSVSMYENCKRLVVLRILSPEKAEIVYDGPGDPAWACAGKPNERNGQRSVSLSKLRQLSGEGIA